MSVDQVEGVVRKRQAFAVGDMKLARQALLLEVRARQVDGRVREVDAGGHGAALREAREIDTGAASNLENRRPRYPSKLTRRSR